MSQSKVVNWACPATPRLQSSGGCIIRIAIAASNNIKRINNQPIKIVLLMQVPEIMAYINTTKTTSSLSAKGKQKQGAREKRHLNIMMTIYL